MKLTRSDVVDRVVDSSPSSDESSPETDFMPEPRAETLPPSKYGRGQTRVERDRETLSRNVDVAAIEGAFFGGKLIF